MDQILEYLTLHHDPAKLIKDYIDYTIEYSVEDTEDGILDLTLSERTAWEKYTFSKIIIDEAAFASMGRKLMRLIARVLTDEVTEETAHPLTPHLSMVGVINDGEPHQYGHLIAYLYESEIFEQPMDINREEGI